MIQIYYEGYTEPATDTSSTSGPHMGFTAVGETPEEVDADMIARSTALRMPRPTAVGLHNKKADWIACFGEEGLSENIAFADYSPPSKETPKELHVTKVYYDPAQTLPALATRFFNLRFFKWLAKHF